MEFTPTSRKMMRGEHEEEGEPCALMFCTRISCKKHRGRLPPGPLCFGCKQQIQGFRVYSIKCSCCQMLYHGSCEGQSNASIKSRKMPWKCTRCKRGLPRGQWTKFEKQKNDRNRKIFLKQVYTLIIPQASVQVTFYMSVLKNK